MLIVEKRSREREPTVMRWLRGLAQAWVILGISLLLLVLVDQLLRVVIPAPAATVAFAPDGPAAPDRERAQAVQADAGWIHDYWNEHAAARDSNWVSYVYWRRQAFAGKHINVDAHGFRATPDSAPEERRTLWLFGGSTVWGTGNRDAGTLAAQLENVYAERAPDLGVRVRNFGESGYVSQQSGLSFQLALRCAEPAPDLAIFLDGPNDVFATLQSGDAGHPQNEDNRRLEFNSANHLSAMLKALAARFEGIGRLVRPPPPAADEPTLARWAAETAAAYLANLKQTRAVAHAYAVDTLFAWQPTVFDRRAPVGDERAIVGASAATHVRLQRQTRAAIEAALAADPGLPLADLGTAFDDLPTAVYFDFVHLSEAGQRALAERLYDLSVASLNARTPHAPRLDHCPARPLG
jgi:lysophospholipase L1-like esterase